MTNYIKDFMHQTIICAKNNPKAPYGSIIVYDNQDIIAISVNDAHNNPIMHGELSVINKLFTSGFYGDCNHPL